MNTPQKRPQKYYGTPVVNKDDNIEKLKSASKSYNPYERTNNGVGAPGNSYVKTPVGVTWKDSQGDKDNPMGSCRRALFSDDKKAPK
ncbi:hypothetical protein KPH14_011099 [Odynerus spinipes]|uniref:Uncharacterized protein n=1 Tax=Odynerus spinipes TaxID=1348599 RepID=A0AAD9RH98_9HYME|nr:hypothetical protein KPH14_011099 [Odynerus spinipes]